LAKKHIDKSKPDIDNMKKEEERKEKAKKMMNNAK